MNLRNVGYCLPLLFIVLGLSGCGGSSGGESSPASTDTTIDTDGDGLTDYEERVTYKTSPIKNDTDGDGISDFDEIVTFSFRPDLNNFQYNPRIADVPQIDIDIVTAPDVALNYTFQDATTGAATTSRATSNTSGVTTSKTNSNSTAIESAVTTGTELTVGAEFEISLEPSATLSVAATMSSSYTDTTSNERSFAWSREQSVENSSTYETAKTLESSKAVSAADGYISTAVKVSNNGNRSFTLSGLTLSAAMISQTSNQIVAPVSNLTYDNSNGSSGFPQTSLAGGGSTGNIIFSANGVDTTTIKNLLADSSGMRVGVAAYELVDINGTPFVFAREQVNASTATVIIDYETLSTPEERYLVTTVADPSALTISADYALADILQKSYAVDATGRLTSIGNIAGDNVTTGWLILHKTTSAGVEVANVYSYNTVYDLGNIALKAGDLLHMVYQIDHDGDMLGQRMEAMLGTDINMSDTDGDGISDYDEVFQGWVVTYPNGTALRVSSSPVLLDTDGDNLTDAEEMALGTDPRSKDTDGDLLNDDTDPEPLVVNYQLHAQNLQATFTDVDVNTGNASLSWSHTWSGNFTSGRDILLRQISTSAAYGTAVPDISASGTPVLSTVGSWLACGAVTNCWEVVGIQATSSNDGIGTYTFSDNGLSRANSYRYAVVSEYNDGTNNYYLLDPINPPVETATLGSLKRVTITLNTVTMAANCVDYWDRNGDFVSYEYSNCEPFYDVRYNNVLIGSRYTTPLQTNTNYKTYSINPTTGSLTPAYDLYINGGTNSWSDTTNPDVSLRSGAATAYMDVLDTVTSVPLQITAGERDLLLNEYGTVWCQDSADNIRTSTINVSANSLLIGTSVTSGTTVSWNYDVDRTGLAYKEAGAVEFSYTVTVTAVP